MAATIFSIWSADCLNREYNTKYPNKHSVTDEASFRTAVQHDYVCAAYKNSQRSGENFVEADCCPADIDNTHSEDPAQWITPHDIVRLFPDVAFLVHYSRHHMQDKVDKDTGRISTARPRFHIIFPIKPCTDKHVYAQMKQRMYERYAFIDKGALDAAHFFFGTAEPEVEFHSGHTTLDAFLDQLDQEDSAAEDFLANINRSAPPIQ